MSEKKKREIIRLNGEIPTVINLEHVTSISICQNRITFSFYINQVYAEMDNEETAKEFYEQVVNVWAENNDLIIPQH